MKERAHRSFTPRNNLCNNTLVENNQGSLLASIGHYEEADRHLRRAHQIFLQLKDAGRVAEVNHTRAGVLIAQGRYRDAERVVYGSIHTFEKSGESSLLAHALITQAVALSRM